MNKITKFFVGAIAALAIFGFAASASAAYVHTGLLKQGTTSSQVKVLQETLNANGFLVSTVGAGSPGMESMYFGSKTKAAVMAFQTAKGLKADGIVGAQTGTALAALTGGSVALPAGCSSTTGFSTTTGLPCTSSANFPAGCTSNSGYSTTTGQSCAGTVTLPAGCTSTAGYSSTTGQKCDSTTGSNNGPLTGGAGTLSMVSTSADVKSQVNQASTDNKVVGARLTAQGSDISLSNVQVELARNTSSTASDRMDRYVGNVSVWLDGNKVGSANISNFYRDGSPYVYSYSIPVSNAVVRQGQSVNLYIAVDVNSVISGSTASGDLSASIKATITNTRYTDATGAILGDSTDVSNSFTFASGYGASVSLAVGSSNPAAGTIVVDSNNSSSSILLLNARLKNDSSATASVKLNRVTANIAVTGAGTSATTIDSVVNSVTISVNGQSYSASRSATGGSWTTGAGNGDANYVIDLSNGLTLNPGQSADINVNATFRGQALNYANGTTVAATLSNTGIDAETNSASATVSGAANGLDMTLNSGKVASYKGGVYQAPQMDGTTTVAKGYIGITFEAGSDLNNVTYTGAGATSGAGLIEFTTSGVTGAASATLYKGSIIDSTQKLTANTDKFYEGSQYTLVVDINSITGGQNAPTIEIENIDSNPLSNVKFIK